MNMPSDASLRMPRLSPPVVPPPPPVIGPGGLGLPGVTSPQGLVGPALAQAQNLDVSTQIAQMMATPPQEETPHGPKGAAKDFAGILFGYMFSEMRPQEDGDGLLGGGDAEMFMNFLDEAIGKGLAQGSGSQLVSALVKELAPKSSHGTASQP